jgi:hypothetical protein
MARHVSLNMRMIIHLLNRIWQKEGKTRAGLVAEHSYTLVLRL